MKYSDICEAKTEAEMQRMFTQHLQDCAKKFGGTPESHRDMQLHNVGYCTGYYDSATARRVHEWLGAFHPIFGTAHADGTLTAADALEAGKKRGRKLRPGR